VRAQFHLTGAAGGVWHLVVAEGHATRGEGVVRTRRHRHRQRRGLGGAAGRPARPRRGVPQRPVAGRGRPHAPHAARGHDRAARHRLTRTRCRRTPTCRDPRTIAATYRARRPAALEREPLVPVLGSRAPARGRARAGLPGRPAAGESLSLHRSGRERGASPRGPRLPMPADELDRLHLDDLVIDWEEPLRRFRLRYGHGDHRMDVVWRRSAGLPLPAPARHDGRGASAPSRAGRDGARQRHHRRRVARDRGRRASRPLVGRGTRLGQVPLVGLPVGGVRTRPLVQRRPHRLRPGADIHLGCLWTGRRCTRSATSRWPSRRPTAARDRSAWTCASPTSAGGRITRWARSVVAVCPVAFDRTWLRDGITRYRMGYAHRLGHPRARLHGATRPFLTGNAHPVCCPGAPAPLRARARPGAARWHAAPPARRRPRKPRPCRSEVVERRHRAGGRGDRGGREPARAAQIVDVMPKRAGHVRELRLPEGAPGRGRPGARRARGQRSARPGRPGARRAGGARARAPQRPPAVRADPGPLRRGHRRPPAARRHKAEMDRAGPASAWPRQPRLRRGAARRNRRARAPSPASSASAAWTSAPSSRTARRWWRSWTRIPWRSSSAVPERWLERLRTGLGAEVRVVSHGDRPFAGRRRLHRSAGGSDQPDGWP